MKDVGDCQGPVGGACKIVTRTKRRIMMRVKQPCATVEIILGSDLVS